MTDPTETPTHVAPAIEIFIKISALFLLLGWCFLILQPFLSTVIWGVIIAVAVYPLFRRLAARLGNRPRLAAALLTLVALLIIILPSVQLAGSMLEGVTNLNQGLQDGSLRIPLPPANVGDWPIIGTAVETVWRQASVNLAAALAPYASELKSLGKLLLEAALHSGLGLLLLTFSFIIAGILLANAEGGGRVVRGLFIRLAGKQGAEFAEDAKVTVRNVVKGILGVAILQALLAGIGFAFAGVPAAGLWAFLCLLLAILQVGIGPVVVPVIIYMFYKATTLTAVSLTVWLVLVLLSDNVLKPILLGRGAPVPMPVIFLGVIGGFMSMGFMGLFVGAVILSLGYKLFGTWLTTGGEEGG